MQARAHVLVSGYVQGVYFRAFVRDHAQRLGVNGWVRNLWDGQVEAVMEGDKEKMERLIVLCRQGPRGARVTGIEVSWEEFQGEFSNFAVRY